MRLLPVVEGPGDVQSVPELIRRVLHVNEIYQVTLLRPYRSGDIYAVRKRFQNLLRSLAKERARILWVLDCDDGCPVEYVAELRPLIPTDLAKVRLRFAFIVREYESMFLANPEVTRRLLRISSDKAFPNAPEALRGAKEWISKNMPAGKAYKETVDQIRLTSSLNLDALRKNSPSFRHFERALLSLVRG